LHSEPSGAAQTLACVSERLVIRSSCASLTERDGRHPFVCGGHEGVLHPSCSLSLWSSQPLSSIPVNPTAPANSHRPPIPSCRCTCSTSIGRTPREALPCATSSKGLLRFACASPMASRRRVSLAPGDRGIRRSSQRHRCQASRRIYEKGWSDQSAAAARPLRASHKAPRLDFMSRAASGPALQAGAPPHPPSDSKEHGVPLASHPPNAVADLSPRPLAPKLHALCSERMLPADDLLAICLCGASSR
jgi:hypothetical protein